MTYLGQQTRARLQANQTVCAQTDQNSTILYNGSTWFLPFVGRYFRARDWIDRKFG
jgi:hypothetical protein